MNNSTVPIAVEKLRPLPSDYRTTAATLPPLDARHRDRPAPAAHTKTKLSQRSSHRPTRSHEADEWARKARMLSFGVVVLAILVVGSALLIIGLSELFTDDGGWSFRL